MSIRIENDEQLRKALDKLEVEQQRRLGARFVDSIRHLSQDASIARGIAVAGEAGPADRDLEKAFREAKAFAVETYTACGRDADWSAQAEHFAATAVCACLTPETPDKVRANLAWQAAMQSRMARTCEMIEADSGQLGDEAARQFRITESFLAELPH